MNCKYLLCSLLIAALTSPALVTAAAMPQTDMVDKMEDSTESPIADLAIIDAELKTSTEKPPVAGVAVAANKPMDKMGEINDAQPHTVADFIIHPLIAFKPRVPEEDVAGKQAAGSSSTTTPSPWTLFGFNAGQGLGSSVSSLAGSVTGWLNDRIQLPGLVDTPVRDSSTTSSTTTTTQRPDVVVRVQHKATTRRPIISISNKNRPNRVNNNLNFDSEEDDDDFEDEEHEEYDDDVPNKPKNQRRRNKNNRRDYDDDEDNRPVQRPNKRPNQRPNQRRRPVFNNSDEDEYDDSQSEEHDDDEENVSQADDDDEDEEEEQGVQRPNNRRRPLQNNNNRRRQQQQRRRQNVGSQRQHSVGAASLRRPQKQVASEEVENDSSDEQFFYGEEQARPSTKRSQSQTGFIQRGQQNLINQIRQLTGGKTPAEIGALMRKSQTTQPAKKKKRRQQATLLVNRNGQTIYVAPELLNTDLSLVNPQVQYFRQGVTQFPQPPLTVPLKRKGRPTQYITIPWSQLGIAPPDQVVSLTEGVQSQPLILNIPQSAINTMQSPKRKKRPVISADAVPLLAETSLMDVFRPPKIPPSRHSTATPIHRPVAISGTPVIIASKTKPSTSSINNSAVLLPQRIRPATIVEKAPASIENQPESDEMSNESAAGEGQTMDALRNTDKEFIIVGEDNEPGLTRQVKPVYGEARYVYGAQRSPYLELLSRGRFGVRKGGRALEPSENVGDIVNMSKEQLIPVQIISDEEMPHELVQSTPQGQTAMQLDEQKQESSILPVKQEVVDPVPSKIEGTSTIQLDEQKQQSSILPVEVVYPVPSEMEGAAADATIAT